MAANPKKAAVLGIVTLVAIYFWAPLLWKWLPGERKPPGVAAASIAPQPSSGATIGRAEQGRSVPIATKAQVNWQQIVQLRAQDPNSKAVALPKDQRDPFVKVQPEQQPVAQAEQNKAQQQPTPQELGLTLTGTLIGPGFKVARINGRSFHQGQTIRAVKGGQTFDFVLAEVEARRVVLQRDSERFELSINDPTKSESIQLTLQ